MSRLDPSRLLTDLQLQAIDFRRVSKAVGDHAGLLIAEQIGREYAANDLDANLESYMVAISPEENLTELRKFALEDFKDEENEAFQKAWFSDAMFDLGVMEGYTGIALNTAEALHAMAQSYWNTTLELFVRFDAEQVSTRTATI